MNKFTALLKKWWPSILTVLAALATALTPQIQTIAAAHAAYTAAILAIWGVILHALQSPVTRPTS